jgi:hypothetical protein
MLEITTAIFSNTTNQLAFGLILFLTLVALIGTFSTSSERLNNYARQSPAILASVGIFFSFWGISIGLIGLDLNDIQNSIPNLLDGLKIKFVASLMGIAASIIVRIALSFQTENETISTEHSELIIIELLKDIKQELSNNNNNAHEQLLLDIKNGLSELDNHNKQNFIDADQNNKNYLTAIGQSIVKGFNTQNELLTNSFIDLSAKFDNFALLLAENTAKAFVIALEKAMLDFNDSMSAQFGENFKELNKAVGQLVIWQTNYKNHIEQLTDNFEIALKSVEKVRTAFIDIESHSQSFALVANELNGILRKLDRQLEDLSLHLQTFDNLADNAKDALPIIEDNLKRLTTEFKKSTEKSLTDINETVNEVGNNLKETSQQLKKTTSDMRTIMEGQKDSIDNTSQEFKKMVSNTLKSSALESQKSIDDYRDSLQSSVTEQLRVIEISIKKSNDIINQSVLQASSKFEQVINSTGENLQIANDRISEQLSYSSNTMQTMMASQEKTLINATGKFEAIVNKTLNNLLDHTQSSLSNYQQSLTRLITEQANALNSNIKNSGNEFERTIKETSLQFTSMASSIKQSIDTQERTLIGVSNDFKTTVDKSLHDLLIQSSSHVKYYESELEKTVNNQMNQLDTVIKLSSEQFNKLLIENTDKSGDLLKQQAERLDIILQDELSKSTKTMSGKLAELSEKFIKDYVPLTNELKKVVKMVEDLKKERNS